jgi:hypothetical protein
LQAAEKRHLQEVTDEPVFDKLAEKMSTILDGYSKYQKKQVKEITAD